MTYFHGDKKLQEHELNQKHNKETNHKKCKFKFNLKLKTQRCKARTWYKLEDYLNITLF